MPGFFHPWFKGRHFLLSPCTFFFPCGATFHIMIFPPLNMFFFPLRFFPVSLYPLFRHQQSEQGSPKQLLFKRAFQSPPPEFPPTFLTHFCLLVSSPCSLLAFWSEPLGPWKLVSLSFTSHYSVDSFCCLGHPPTSPPYPAPTSSSCTPTGTP